MTWKTFAGEEEEIYRLLLVDRCQAEHGMVDKEVLAKTARQHIARGAARLVSKRDLKSISELLVLACRIAERVATEGTVLSADHAA